MQRDLRDLTERFESQTRASSSAPDVGQFLRDYLDLFLPMLIWSALLGFVLWAVYPRCSFGGRVPRRASSRWASPYGFVTARGTLPWSSIAARCSSSTALRCWSSCPWSTSRSHGSRCSTVSGHRGTARSRRFTTRRHGQTSSRRAEGSPDNPVARDEAGRLPSSRRDQQHGRRAVPGSASCNFASACQADGGKGASHARGFESLFTGVGRRRMRVGTLWRGWSARQLRAPCRPVSPTGTHSFTAMHSARRREGGSRDVRVHTHR